MTSENEDFKYINSQEGEFCLTYLYMCVCVCVCVCVCMCV
jgi:hypothetical protein